MRRLPSAGEQEIRLPDPDLLEGTFNREDLPGAALLDRAVGGLPATVFGWLLELTVVLEETDELALPTAPERAIVDAFSERLSEALLDLDDEQDPGPVNALFLLRLDWNGTRELVYRVHDPEVADDLLAFVVESGDYPRPFAYRLVEDQAGERCAARLLVAGD